MQVAELSIEREELEEVAVPADRRAGAAVAGALPVVQPVARVQADAAMPSGNDVVSGGRSYSTQCTQVIFGAAGSGASGSSTISARLCAPAGTPSIASGGETSSPSQVCLRGMLP